MKGGKRKKYLSTILAFFCLLILSVLVIAENTDHCEKGVEKWKHRLEQKKKELRERNIDVNSVMPREIEDLLDSKVLTTDDVENLFPMSPFLT